MTCHHHDTVWSSFTTSAKTYPHTDNVTQWQDYDFPNQLKFPQQHNSVSFRTDSATPHKTRFDMLRNHLKQKRENSAISIQSTTARKVQQFTIMVLKLTTSPNNTTEALLQTPCHGTSLTNCESTFQNPVPTTFPAISYSHSRHNVTGITESYSTTITF